MTRSDNDYNVNGKDTVQYIM